MYSRILLIYFRYRFDIDLIYFGYWDWKEREADVELGEVMLDLIAYIAWEKEYKIAKACSEADVLDGAMVDFKCWLAVDKHDDSKLLAALGAERFGEIGQTA